jgi:SAM-dependent methyltransferase
VTKKLIPSPNIWNWPEVYERENAAQDVDGAIWAALREETPWVGRDVVDVGCGDGFHLRFFAEARSVLGVEPYAPLVERAQGKSLPVVLGAAASLPLRDASVDLVHARTAYFFGPGCEPGLVEAWRVLRPGGAMAIIDLDASAPPYGDWMRADIPHYDPVAAERFFTRAGFSLRRIPTRWRFADRATCEAVLRIEFSAAVAERALAQVPDRTVTVGYRMHIRHKRLTL